MTTEGRGVGASMPRPRPGRSYQIEVPGVPLSANARRRSTWTRVYGEGQPFKEAALLLARQVHHGPPLERARVTATLVRRGGRALDPDGAPLYLGQQGGQRATIRRQIKRARTVLQTPAGAAHGRGRSACIPSLQRVGTVMSWPKGRPRSPETIAKKTLPRKTVCCLTCGVEFTVRCTSTRTYCSQRCAWASKTRIVERPKERGTRVCPQCKRTWVVTTARARASHCSVACAQAAQAARATAIDMVCATCGKTFRVKLSHRSVRTHCSLRCLNTDDDLMQKRSDHMMQRHRSDQRLRSGTGRCHGGKRADLGGMYFRSAWEANIARYLNWLKARGEIHEWSYESVTFWFEAIKRGVRSYTPDFRIVDQPGAPAYFWEVKGWQHPRGMTALHRMAKYYPQVRVVLIDADAYKAIRKWRALIPGWE